MLPFSGYGPIGHSERKALLFAGLFSCVFIVILGLGSLHRRPTIRTTYTFPGELPVTAYKFPQHETLSDDSLDRFRVRPEHFELINFRNFSYGPYTSSNGKKIDLNLEGGALQLPNRAGWFALKDVYYTDMTGDGQEEAIVWLFHVTCGASCDGGANLFYIYTARDGKLKRIWQYETGTYENGRGLKSLILSDKQIVVELFGDYTTMDGLGPSKFIAQGFTSMRLEFDGRRFAQKSIDFFTTPPKDIKAHEPDIHIYAPLGPQGDSNLLP